MTRAVDRCHEVGGLPRYIFQSDQIFETRKIDIATHSAATDFFSTLEKNNPYKLTTSAKFIIAPISLSSTSWCYTVEDTRVRFVYLSESCERQVIKYLSESNLNKLRAMREQFGDWLTDASIRIAAATHDKH